MFVDNHTINSGNDRQYAMTYRNGMNVSIYDAVLRTAGGAFEVTGK
jgi:hypothetical protein